MTFKEFKEMVNSLEVPDDTPVVVMEPYDDGIDYEPFVIRYDELRTRVEIY